MKGMSRILNFFINLFFSVIEAESTPTVATLAPQWLLTT